MFDKNNNPTSVTSMFQRSLLLAVIATAVSISIILIIQEFHSFSKEAQLLEKKYLAEKKSNIKQEVLRVTKYISNAKKITTESIRKKIKNRTY